MSKRETDSNGFWLIRDNPISKVGVYPYLGSEIGAENPDKIYMVYRPEEELSDPETMESFNLMPFINDHEFLGKDGTPAEKKGVQGTTGETPHFEFPYLKNNLRVFSSFLQEQIDQGKVELSPSYKCDYDFTPGVFEDQEYDAVQRNIRGNHLALVKKGRTGPDVAVLDHYTITNDSMEFIMEFTEEQLAQIKAIFEELLAAKAAADAEAEEKKAKDAENGDPDKDKETGDETGEEAVQAAAEEAAQVVTVAEEAIEEVKEALAEVEEAAAAVTSAPTADSVEKLNLAMAKLKKLQAKPVKKPAPVMDSATVIRQLAARDKLVNQLKPHIGTFDTSDMTSATEVARYATKKLGLKVSDGAELATIQGYLMAAKTETVVEDSAITIRGTETANKLWSQK